jgi:hypothetical protein
MHLALADRANGLARIMYSRRQAVGDGAATLLRLDQTP